MEHRMVKFYAKESNKVAVHAMQGHFATSNSHINYYIDVNSIKTRAKEAKEVARVLRSKIGTLAYVDTIVCMDGTEVIGAFLAEEFERNNYMSTNHHDTVYVVSPEENSNSQMIFRDNNRGAITDKHILLLSATTTTGETIRKSLECIRYYGGIIEGIASIFATVNEVEGIKVQSIFTEADVPGYAAYSPSECPFCQKGEKIEAMVNGFGYSKF